ncbi:hypothetical protein JG688_00014669, partial [Phytophthora aleatoria]
DPTWDRVQAVVIDKDFVEWAVLERCLPQAKVLLCQFHAIISWKNLFIRRLYDLRITQRERLQSMFMQMQKR